MNGAEREARLLMANSYRAMVYLSESKLIRLGASLGSGKTEVYLWLATQQVETASAIRAAGERLRNAITASERRTAAREFLEALSDLMLSLLCFLVRVLLLLLSRSLSRAKHEDVPVWQPEPIDTSPQIRPRGPNSALPVTTYRGGHYRSALGSAV
ncbi:hypothetical protein [Streptomyces javensis]|uniref:Uncharacterized protein n=1 Tax=Streptomyces javensis TaxID=114698 RepID=A0ABN1XGL7_9ACTN